MTKPQTLAEQILSLKPVGERSLQWQYGYRECTQDAAALADAAATTTPAEQAGDVRQAVRVKETDSLSDSKGVE